MTPQRRAVKHVNRIIRHLVPEESGVGVSVLDPIIEDIEDDVDDPNDGDDDDDGDIDDDDDDDDDDDMTRAEAEKILIAGDDTSVLSESKVCFIRFPERPGKLFMVAQIEDILPEAENEEDNFDCSGTEMFEANLIIHLGKGHAGAKKPLNLSIDPKFFKKKNFDADVYDVPAAQDD